MTQLVGVLLLREDSRLEMTLPALSASLTVDIAVLFARAMILRAAILQLALAKVFQCSFRTVPRPSDRSSVSYKRLPSRPIVLAHCWIPLLRQFLSWHSPRKVMRVLFPREILPPKASRRELCILEIAWDPYPPRLNEERIKMTDVNVIKQIHTHIYTEKTILIKKLCRIRKIVQKLYTVDTPFFINLNRNKKY